MAEPPKTGQEQLTYAWWLAVAELVEIIGLSEDVNARIRASEVVLNYCTSLNVGIGDPFLPAEQPDLWEDDDDD